MRDRLGMSVREVLRAATSSAALLLGTRAGTLACGFPADLVLLDVDPEADFERALRAPAAVVKAGRVVSARV